MTHYFSITQCILTNIASNSPTPSQHQAYVFFLPSGYGIWILDALPLPSAPAPDREPQPSANPAAPCWPTMLRTELAWPRPGQGSGRSQGARELTGGPDRFVPFGAKTLGFDSQSRAEELPHTPWLQLQPPPIPPALRPTLLSKMQQKVTLISCFLWTKLSSDGIWKLTGRIFHRVVESHTLETIHANPTVQSHKQGWRKDGLAQWCSDHHEREFCWQYRHQAQRSPRLILLKSELYSHSYVVWPRRQPPQVRGIHSQRPRAAPGQKENPEGVSL